MTADAARPLLHFTTRAGWINDPLGLTFHDGRYHLFFQYVPGTTQWAADQRWGHAVSDDLLHWTERPVALAPGEGDDGIWSGSIAVPDDGPAALFYTSVDTGDPSIGRVRLARPTDDSWDEWVKGDVVAELPAGFDVVAYRDPYVFRDGDGWRMLVGAGLTDGTATALTYRSDDLETWTYDGPLASRHRDEVEPLWTGAGWECPQLLRLGDRWVLTVSVWEPSGPHDQVYAVGDLAGGRFTPRAWGRLTYGPSLYAGAAFTDADGVRGLIHWLRGVDDTAAGWASAHSVPHTVRLEGDRLVAEPHAAVARARTGGPVRLRDGVAEVDPHSDLVLTLDDADADAAVRLDGAGRPRAGADVPPGLELRVTGGRLSATTAAGTWTMPVDGTSVRVLVDGPVVEVFTRGGTMAVPARLPGTGRRLTVAGGVAAEVWRVA